MQVLQLYIEGQQIELFDDESVKMTQSIKDVKDIAKVFTEFTKTFTVPASKENNKIFMHYYNPDIVGGFDARKKKSAEITLNYAPFKKGKIKLDSIEMKNNKPYSYKITFFGNTIQLKDLLGEDKLSDVQQLNAIESTLRTYNSSMIYSGLVNRNPNLTSTRFIVPMITHTQRLFFDSADTVADRGNMFHGTVKTGVEFNNLKPAVRLYNVLEKIEEKYGITFSDDFFNTSNESFFRLFMWLHRKKGSVESSDATQKYENVVTGLGLGPDNTGDIIGYGETIEVTENAVDKLLNSYINLETTSSNEYNLRIYRNNQVIYSENDIVGNKQVQYINWIGGFQSGVYKIVVEVAEGVTINFSTVEFFYSNTDSPSVTDSFETTVFSAVSEVQFLIAEQIPEMKVIDFLSGLFKMFNLVAYVDDDDTTIVVKTLDDYYDVNYSGTTPNNIEIFDISQYVDVEKSSIEPSLPFKEIHFGYKDTGTVLAQNHNQFFNEEWGEAEYDGSENDETIDKNVYGDIYKVELPFHHMKYERLINNANNKPTDIQYGFFVDDNLDPYYGKPLLFYPIRTIITAFSPTNGGTGEMPIVYSFNNDGTYNTITTVPVNYPVNMPSNTLNFDSSPTDLDSIHFNSYPSEYTGIEYTDSLFEKYYKNYIKDVFEPINRLIKVKAFLPIKILQKLKMNDRIVINDRQHRINKITSNLKTGESQIELLND